jgi:nudix-type nucleoside diphosphatase (YffH/AdpP family)
MKLLEQKVVYQGWGRFLLLKVKLAGGAVVTRQLEDHGRAAAVLPYDSERRVALVARMPRPGPMFNGEDPMIVETCAGIVDSGESAEDCARREAFEELGVRLTALEPVVSAYTAPGVSSETISLYLAPYAASDRIAAGGGLEVENEEIEVLERPLAALALEADGGIIRDLKTLALILVLRTRRPELFG